MVTTHALHKRATRVLPEVIQTSGVLLPDCGESGLEALLFPLRRKSSGSLMFRISTDSFARFSNNPVDFLMQATRAREGIGRRAEPFEYRPWRKAIYLFAGADEENRHAVKQRAQDIEVYFTTKTDGKALLVLVPEDRMLIYVWND